MAGAVAVLVDPSMTAVEVAAVALVPAALGAAASGLVSTVKGAPDPNEDQALLPPEAAGPRLAIRTALAARAGGRRARARAGWAGPRSRTGGRRSQGTADAVFVVIAVFALVCAWVRYREEMRRSMQEQMRTQAQTRGSAGG